ncbi:tetratricopeptide repeat protein [Aeoliella mucimassa]|uniref:Tetratricopeptide repeat protein n=1 Tax=Aeoliella mucimassa TaxID=2527972 RepID=A0A518AIK7_9BACT|nr:tetratricopeptide repeat protein [Aeoliella mucimassa]QDU54569.1 Tetratricopeptide repeat protein [Aeoliella mucimassa]
MESNAPTTELKLTGERIALVSKLVSMPRNEASKVISAHGGHLQAKPDESTTLLVKGDDMATTAVAEQLPEEVRQRVAAGRVTLVDESQLWRRLGLVDEEVGVSRLYTPALLAEMVEVEGRVIHRWHRRGYLEPACEVRKLPYFDFAEVRVARRLAELVHAGVSLASIDRQMADLARLAPDVDRPLANLSIVVEGGKIYLRRGSDLAEPSGQLLIDFDAAEEEPVPEIANPGQSEVPPSAEELRARALDLADEGEVAPAIELYRGVMLAGEADAEDHFMLGDLLYQRGDLSAARERYYMAIEQDEEYDEARVNLGCVLLELGDIAMAADAFRGALAGNPHLADAHYHLAGTLDRLGDNDSAREHWQAFLELAPESPWAEEAHERLGE